MMKLRLCQIVWLITILSSSALPEKPVSSYDRSMPSRASAVPESPWTLDLNLRLDGGQRDNVLLSAVREERSYLIGTELEVMALHLPESGDSNFYWYLSGQNDFYPEVKSGDRESTVLTQSQYVLQRPSGLSLGASVQYLYLDQAYDVSITDTDSTQTRLRLHQVELRPFVKQPLSESRELQFDVPVRRAFFGDSTDDYTEPGVKVQLIQRLPAEGRLTGSYEFAWRFANKREQRDKAGIALPGTTAEWFGNEVALDWQQKWGSKKRFQTTTRGAVKYFFDDGQGYEDFTRYKIFEKLSYTFEGWELYAKVSMSWYRYPGQTGDPPDNSDRTRRDFTTEVSVERKITDRVKLFVTHESDDAESNRNADDQRDQIVRIGTDVAF